MPVSQEDMKLVGHVARRLHNRLTDDTEIVSDGMLGLHEAVKAWDAGDVPPGWLRESWIKCVVRRRCIDGLRQRGGRAQRGSETHPRFKFETGMLRLDEVAYHTRGGRGQDETLLDRFVGYDDDTLGNLIAEDMLAALPQREAEVVRRNVLEREPEHLIAQEWGVTDSRISQIRSAAVLHLRDYLQTGRKAAKVKETKPMGVHGLSEREVEILQRVADGDGNKEIAVGLILSVETVKSHLRHILTKLDARTRTHAVAIGFRAGLLR